MLEPLGPTVAPERLVQQRARRAAHRARRRRQRPGTWSRDGGPRRRPHRLPVRDRAAADRRRAQRRHRARRRVRRRRRRPRGPRASWSQALPRATAASRCSTPTTRWWPRWPTSPPPGCVTLRARAGRRRARRATSRSTTQGRAVVRAADRRHGAAEVHAAAARRAPGRRTRWPPPRSPSSSGVDRRRGRRRAGRRRAAQPVADGGHRAAGRRDRRQRRLQRQPRLGARPRWPRSSRWRGGRRTWAVLGEMLELGAASAAEHAAGRQTGRAGSGVDRVVAVGRGRRADPCRRRRRRCRATERSSVPCRTSTPRSPCCAPSCARRRGAGQGLAAAAGLALARQSRRTGRRAASARGAGPVRQVLLAASFGADRHAVRHAAGDPAAGPPRLRPADPRRRPDLAPHQARHADHGRRRHHPRHPARLRRRAPASRWRDPTVSGLLVLFLMTGLGLVGFLDDYIKVAKQRSLGLRAGAKLVGQSVVAVTFAVLATAVPGRAGLHARVDRDLVHPRHRRRRSAPCCFVVWAYVMIAGTSNGVNLTDGLDGLATGTSVMVFASYVLIGIWQFGAELRRSTPPPPKCYEVRDPLDLAVVAAAIMGACFGFLWWNASPAKIFMGDTGSLALGGALAGLAITSRTELLLVLIGGLFVLITLSVIIQVGFFKLTRQTGVPDGAAAAPLRARRAGARSRSSSGSGSSPGCSSRSGSACSTPSGSPAPARDRTRRSRRSTARGSASPVSASPGAAVARALARPRCARSSPSTAVTANASMLAPASCAPPGSTVRLGDGDTLPVGADARRHLARLAAGLSRCSSPPRPAASRCGARSSWPGGCATRAVAVARRHRHQRQDHDGADARRRSCAPPGTARSPPATSGCRCSTRCSPTRRTTCSPSSCPASSCTGPPRSSSPPARVLNIAPDHLDWHGSLEAYAAAKALVWRGDGTCVVQRRRRRSSPGWLRAAARTGSGVHARRPGSDAARRRRRRPGRPCIGVDADDVESTVRAAAWSIGGLSDVPAAARTTSRTPWPPPRWPGPRSATGVGSPCTRVAATGLRGLPTPARTASRYVATVARRRRTSTTPRRPTRTPRPRRCRRSTARRLGRRRAGQGRRRFDELVAATARPAARRGADRAPTAR